MASLPFTTTEQFPASVDRLWRACSRRTYVERKYHALGDASMRVLDFRVGARHIEVLLERGVAPSLARFASWLPDMLVLRHHTRWWRTGPGSVRVRVEIATAGLPVRVEATGELRELSPGSTEMQLQWQLRGEGAFWATAAIQRLFRQQVRQALRRDHAFTLRYLRDAG